METKDELRLLASTILRLNLLIQNLSPDQKNALQDIKEYGYLKE